MRKLYFLIAFLLFVLFASFIEKSSESDIIVQQVPLEGNNIRAWIVNTGIFDADLRTNNHSGFEWPKDSGKFAVYSAGLSIAALVNGQLRMAMASWTGEFAPGYIVDSSGVPVARTDSRFRIYSVKRSDSWVNNPDWLNWGYMVPYGAPYVDVNNSGYYEFMLDTPGVRGASQTVFCCLTDGFTNTHSTGEGFGGGTQPMYAESHLTAWAYDLSGLQDVQFFKWVIINRHNSSWNGTFFSLISDTELGNAGDDYVGCDTIRKMGYCYNSDNFDDTSHWEPGYGSNPPALGFDLLLSPINKHTSPPVVYGMKSFNSFMGTSVPGPSCEKDPNGEPDLAYKFMRGLKKDGTPWLNPMYNPPRRTKICYPGDPETNSGWTEYTGKINNCGGDTTGNVVPSPPGDRRLMISSGADNFTVSPGDTQIIMIAQFIARGTSNLNSVTKLKQLDDFIQAFVDNGFVIGVEPISNNIPDKFILRQNYPNPFNPVTKIKFEIPYRMKSEKSKVKIVIYDVLGRVVEVLLNEKLSPGTFEVDWDASNYPSGVYFYRLIIGDVSITKKMVLLK